MLGRILALKRPPVASTMLLVLSHLKHPYKGAREDVVIPDPGA